MPNFNTTYESSFELLLGVVLVLQAFTARASLGKGENMWEGSLWLGEEKICLIQGEEKHSSLLSSGEKEPSMQSLTLFLQ